MIILLLFILSFSSGTSTDPIECEQGLILSHIGRCVPPDFYDCSGVITQEKIDFILEYNKERGIDSTVFLYTMKVCLELITSSDTSTDPVAPPQPPQFIPCTITAMTQEAMDMAINWQIYMGIDTTNLLNSFQRCLDSLYPPDDFADIDTTSNTSTDNDSHVTPEPEPKIQFPTIGCNLYEMKCGIKWREI